MKRLHEFAGRAAELQRLSASLHRAAEGHPKIVVIRGRQGVGRSALLARFARIAAARERPAWVIRTAPRADEPYRPVELAALAASVAHRFAPTGQVRAAWQYLKHWIGAIPLIGSILAAILATESAVRSRRSVPRPSVLPVDSHGRALLEEARRHAIVVLADDLHLVDRVGTEQIERLVHSASSGMRLLFVATYTPVSSGGTVSPFESLLETFADGLVSRWTLDGLNDAELAGWVSRRYPGAVLPPGFLSWLRTVAGGHPTTLGRIFKELEDASIISFRDSRWTVSFTASAPDPPIDSAPPAADPAGIDAVTQELLRAAASLGDQFDGDAVASLTGVDELEVEDRLAMAVHRGIVVVTGECLGRDGDPSTVYRFTSSAVRAALARLPPATAPPGAIFPDPPGTARVKVRSGQEPPAPLPFSGP